MIMMLPESKRPPFSITWAEQDRLFSRLPTHLQRMVLFAVNVGLRDNNVWGIYWTWEVPVPEISRSIFVVPAEAFGRRIDTMNNTGRQLARRAVGLQRFRAHDLRHTFACRLRAAGVSSEDRLALLGHAIHSMSGHYASADVGRLVTLANLVLNRDETRTLLRLANGWPVADSLWINRPTAVPQ